MDALSVLLAVVGLFSCIIFGVFVYITVLIALVHAKYDHLPGPKRTSFYFGNSMELRAKSRSHNKDYSGKDEKLLKPIRPVIFASWAREYGDTFVLFLIHRAIVITRSASIIKNALVHSDQRKFPKLSVTPARFLYGERLLGDGLATTPDHDAWYPRRKLMEPVFHRRHLYNSIDVFNATGDKFVEELNGHSESGESFLLSHILHFTTLDVIIKTMFSMDFPGISSEFHQEAFNFVFTTFEGVHKAFIPLVQYNPYFYRSVQIVCRHVASFRKLAAETIEERKAAVLNEDVVPDDMLTAMVKASLDSSSGYTFEIMVDEFLTIIVAGMETSANTLGFAFMELGRRPDLLKRLVEEVDEVVGKKPFISNEDITKLSFTTMLIKETLRLYSPVGEIFRKIRDEVELDGLRLPADTELLVNIFAANRNEQYVDNPNEFDPSRFDPKQEKRVPMYSFVSFSLGARNCIGQVFAQMEMKVMIAKFFQHYELHLDKGETFELGQMTSIHPLSGVKCTVKPRLQ